MGARSLGLVVAALALTVLGCGCDARRGQAAGPPRGAPREPGPDALVLGGVWCSGRHDAEKLPAPATPWRDAIEYVARDGFYAYAKRGTRSRVAACSVWAEPQPEGAPSVAVVEARFDDGATLTAEFSDGSTTWRLVLDAPISADAARRALVGIGAHGAAAVHGEDEPGRREDLPPDLQALPVSAAEGGPGIAFGFVEPGSFEAYLVRPTGDVTEFVGYGVDGETEFRWIGRR